MINLKYLILITYSYHGDTFPSDTDDARVIKSQGANFTVRSVTNELARKVPP